MRLNQGERLTPSSKQVNQLTLNTGLLILSQIKSHLRLAFSRCPRTIKQQIASCMYLEISQQGRDFRIGRNGFCRIKWKLQVTHGVALCRVY